MAPTAQCLRGAPPATPRLRTVLVTGKGRSGTTWLKLLAFTRDYPRGRVVVHEAPAADPHAQTRESFDFLGWRISASTHAFIEASVAGRRGGDDFYGVYRNPADATGSWRSELSPRDIEGIGRIVRTSPILDLWPDLPI